MKIGIDARFYNEAGPGRYVKNLLKHLQEIDRKNDYVVFLKESNFSDFTPAHPNFKKVLAPYHWYTLAEQLFFPIKIYRQRVDLMHFTQFNVPLLWLGRYVVTIHDMIIHEFSLEKESLGKKIVYRLKKPIFFLIFSLACRRAAHILVPSQTTKNDLVSKLKLAPGKITVTYEGVDEIFRVQNSKFKSQNYEEDRKILERYGVQKPYLLYVGSMYPHKNLERLVEAFRLLRGNYHFPGRLVLVGKESYFSQRLRERVRERGMGSLVIFPAAKTADGYVKDEENLSFFRQASVYVFPSLKEGFGLSPLEAMGVGTPVAVSNISAMPEICGSAALYFNPYSVEEMTEKINQLLTNPQLVEELVARARRWALRFSWLNMAEATLAAYHQA